MPKISLFIPEDVEKLGALVILTPGFQNFGGTRTAYFRAHISLKYFESGVPANLNLDRPYIERDLSSDTVIGPNSLYEGFSVAMPASDLKKAKDGGGQILWWGMAEWSDIFEPKKVRKIRYCRLLVAQNAQDGKLTLTNLPYQPTCNTSD